jgi:hypothetical protein
MAIEDKTGDDDVSPMEAQNTGPAKKGPAEAPLRQEKPGESGQVPKSRDSPMRPGGEGATRDDL